MNDTRIISYCEAIQNMKQGKFGMNFVPDGEDDLAVLGKELVELEQVLEKKI